LNNDTRDYIFFFKIKAYDIHDFPIKLAKRIDRIGSNIKRYNAEILDWTFDDELGYLFIIVKCPSNAVENIGALIRRSIQRIREGVNIERKGSAVISRKIFASRSKRFLFLIFYEALGIYGDEIKEKMNLGYSTEKLRLSSSLLYICYLENGIDFQMRAIFDLYYPMYLSSDYSPSDVESCLSFLLKSNMLTLTGDKYTLTKDGESFLRNILEFLDNKFQQKEEEYRSVFAKFDRINKSLARIIRRDGIFEDFRVERIIGSLIKCGIPEDVVFKLVPAVTAVLSHIDVLSRDDVVEAVRYSLEKIDRSGEYSSIFEFYVNTAKYLFFKDEDGRIHPITISNIRKALSRKLKSIPMKVSEGIIDDLAAKVCYDLKLLYSTVSPMLKIKEEHIVVDKFLINRIIEKELELKLPYYKRLAKKSFSCSEVKKLIDTLLSDAEEEFRKISEIHDLEGRIRYFSRAAYKLISAVLLRYSYMPSISYVSNCSLLLNILKRVPIEEALVGKLRGFSRAALKIIHMDPNDIELDKSKAMKFISDISRLGYKLCLTLRS